MWGCYHLLRTASEFKEGWRKSLANSIGHKPNHAFYQFVVHTLFTDLIKLKYPTQDDFDKPASLNNSPLTQEDEEYALRYVAGYVCRKVQSRLESLPQEHSESMVYLLSELITLSGSLDEMDWSADWIRAIDRGGLLHVSDKAHRLFQSNQASNSSKSYPSLLPRPHPSIKGIEF